MHRLRMATSLLVVFSCLAACQASPTPVAPTAVVATQAPAATTAPTAVPPSPVPTTAPTATTAPTEVPTAVPSTATAEVASLQNLRDAAFDADDKLYISDCGATGGRIFAIDSSGTLELYAGAGDDADVDGGPATEALFWCLDDIAFDSAGNLYINDAFNSRIRRIAPDGTMSTVAGSGPVGDFIAGRAPGGFAGDGGPATEALLSDPAAIALDQQGNLYILDLGNYRVRMVDQAGMITTIAGVGTRGFSGDGGPATAAEIGSSDGIAVDAAGNVYIADTNNARIRMVDLNGIITTLAGTGEPGFSGDGGPAAQAQLARPTALAIDAAGSLYFVDAATVTSETDRIRKIDADGTITTVTSFTHPGNLFADRGAILSVDSQGNLYYLSPGNNVLRKIDKDGRDTVATQGCFECPYP